MGIKKCQKLSGVFSNNTTLKKNCEMLLRLFQMMNTMPTCSSDAKLWL